jgi:hypothetical protein
VSKVAVVLARQKPMAEIPAWALCCEAIREIYRTQDATGLTVEAVPSTAFLGEVECRFCHRIVDDVKYVRQITNRGKGAIPIECFEFDERPIRYVDSRSFR